jgi:rod shape-determining protein MreB
MLDKILSYFSEDIAIDLGTANSLVYVRGRGIVITEPSVVALNKKTGQVLAIGAEAKKMVGRTPGYIVATRPLVSGVVSDFEVTEQMLRYFIEKAHKKKFLLNPRPRVIIGIPCGVTEVEKKAVCDAAKNAGAREVFLIEEPMAAAIGAHLEVQEAGGNFIVDIGGGTTEVAIISLGGIVLSKSLRVAGDKLNEDIIQFAQEEYKLLIGERTAETIKIGIGSACPVKNHNLSVSSKSEKTAKSQMPMRGRNLVTGLPEEILVSDEDIRRALEKSVKQITDEIKTAVEETPPELLADIMASGIQLAGGGSLLKGLDTLIQKETKIPTKIIEDPMTAMVRGAGMVLENLDELREVLSETEYLEPPK